VSHIRTEGICIGALVNFFHSFALPTWLDRQEFRLLFERGACVREMLRDQIRWIYNRDHTRKLAKENGRESLAMVVEATRWADQSR
jgi:hypothetical protein